MHGEVLPCRQQGAQRPRLQGLSELEEQQPLPCQSCHGNSIPHCSGGACFQDWAEASLAVEEGWWGLRLLPESKAGAGLCRGRELSGLKLRAPSQAGNVNTHMGAHPRLHPPSPSGPLKS